MKVLAIETATEACSAALLIGDSLHERYQLAPREHNRLILPMIEALLAEADCPARSLDLIAFGRGPGSFTGVRMAAGVTQGLALGLDLPVIGISTLAALAFDALARYPALARAYPCLDARMHEVYWAVYDRDADGYPQLAGQERVCPAATVTVPPGMAGIGIGSGWSTYADILSRKAEGCLAAVLSDRFPGAGAVARLAARRFPREGGVPAELALPVYLRDDVARKPAVAGTRPDGSPGSLV